MSRNTNLIRGCGVAIAALLTVRAEAQALSQHQSITGLRAPVATADRQGRRVVTVASPLPDAINMHVVETPAGLVLFDALRTTEQVADIARLIGRLGKPPLALFITHAHTDHYGGVAALKRRYPDLPVYAPAAVASAMRSDPNGDNRRRREMFGGRFPTQAEINNALPTRPVEDGVPIEVGGLRIEPLIFGPSESPAAAVYRLPELGAAVTGDLVNVLTVPAPFESLEAWLTQLDRIESALAPETLIHVGHGSSGPAAPLIAEQRAFLVQLRTLVASALADGAVAPSEREAIVRELRLAFPHYRGAALLPPDELIRRGVDAVAGQIKASRAAHGRELSRVSPEFALRDLRPSAAN